MKKNLFLAAFAVVAMASCSKTEVADPSSVSTESAAIGFTTFIDRATKGAVADQTTLQTNGFGVICYETTDKVDWSTSHTGVTTIMGGDDKTTPLSVTYASGAWSYGNLVYWADDAKLSFFAYSPTSQTTDNTITAAFSDNTSTDTTVLPTITFEAECTIANQVDLLAVSKMNQENNGSPVDFDFAHILSKIGFTVQADLSTEKTAVVVTDVEVTVVDNTTVDGSSGETLDAVGVFTFGDGGSNAAKWVSTETAEVKATALVIAAESIFDADKYNYYTSDLADTDGSNDSFYLAQNDTEAHDITDAKQYLMIVPQALDAADIIKVEVTYYYIADTDSPSLGSELTKTVYIPTITYEMGKAYTYNIKVGKDAIVFASTIGVSNFDAGYTNGTDGNLDLN